MLLVAFIVAGLALWFSDVWVQESTLEHSVLGGFGLLLAIYCLLIIRKRRRPPDARNAGSRVRGQSGAGH